MTPFAIFLPDVMAVKFIGGMYVNDSKIFPYAPTSQITQLFKCETHYGSYRSHYVSQFRAFTSQN